MSIYDSYLKIPLVDDAGAVGRFEDIMIIWKTFAKHFNLFLSGLKN